MKKILNMAFVGDSNGITIIQGGEAQGFSFRYAIRAAAPNFVNARLLAEKNGLASFVMPEIGRAKPNVSREDQISERQARATRMSVQFNQAFERKIPFYSTVGTATFRFIRHVEVLAREDGVEISSISKKILKIAADSHIDQYIGFYKDLIERTPKVTVVFGPTRYDNANRDAWLIYEDRMADRLGEIGVDVLDIRGKFGGEDLAIRDEFLKSDDDGVHANLEWGKGVFNEIRKDFEGV